MKENLVIVLLICITAFAMLIFHENREDKRNRYFADQLDTGFQELEWAVESLRK